MENDSIYGLIFDACGGQKFSFIKMHDPRTMKVWWIHESHNCKEASIKGLRVDKVDIQTLKDIGVWDKLEAEVQKELTEVVKQGIKDVNNLMEKARAARRNRYDNIPKEIVCTKCNQVIKVIPSVVAAKVNKAGVMLVDYIAKFECSVCNPPKRGRKPKKAN